MISLYQNKEECCGCTACFHECSRSAITMVTDDEGFLYPEINGALCIACKACLKVCPFKKKNYKSLYPENQTIYGLKHKVDSVRIDSASGGAFTAISDYIIKNNGVVYGAIFNDNYEVIHNQATTFEIRDRMRGSKYVQSSLDCIFHEIKKLLLNDELVMFSGTPCQVDGLKSYLKKDYNRLITCDIACHGVTSPKVWEAYKHIIQKKYNETISGVAFRCKEKGWKKSALKIELNTNIYMKNMQEDPYYILFFNHINLRPSCYNCVYTTYHRFSDITLADFWGIERANKEFFDDLGISLVFGNSDKGNELINQIKTDVDLFESDYKSCYQAVFDKPCKRPVLRDDFWCLYKSDPERAILRYGKLTLKEKMIKKVIVPILKLTGLYNLVLKVYVNKT